MQSHPQASDASDRKGDSIVSNGSAVHMGSPALPAQRLSLFLNTLLGLLLEDIPLERQISASLDLILAMLAPPLSPQGAIFLTDESSDTLTLTASRNLSPACKFCGRLSFGRHLCGHAAARADHQLTDAQTIPCSVMNEELLLPGRVAIALRSDGVTLGVLMLGLDPECPRSDDDAEFLEGAASVLARMIAHRRDAQRTRRLLEVNRQLNRQIITKQEEEYRRIARELHDDIGQSIAAIKTEVALLAQTTDSGEASRGAKAIGAEADRIYETMHETVRRLRPGVLDDLGLVAAIRVYITDWQARRPVMSCRFNAEGQFDDIDEAVKVTAYRLVQESLTNVVRHATATEVRVSLSRQTAESQGLRGWVVIEVADNGRGMEAAKLHAQKGRFGLLGMRERVEGLAGVFTIVTAAGKGFHLHARLPLVERRTRPRG